MAGNVRTPSTTTERNFQVKTKEGDSQAAYLEDKIDGSTYINITEEDGTYGKKLVVEADISAINGGVTTDKVKVSGADPTAEYLEDKITAGTGIEATCDDDTVTVALDAELKDLNDVDDSLSPSDKDILVYDGVTDNQWETSHGLETTFSGTTTKIPTALALSTLLKTLIVTNDADLGTGGTPLMYHEDNFDSSRILIVSDSFTNLISNYPAPADLIACVPDRRTDATTAAALGTVGENAWDRVAYGDLFIGTYEGDDEDADNFVGAYLETLLQEDYLDTESVYIDVLFKLPDVGGTASEIKVKAFPYYAKSGSTDRTALTAVEKTISTSGTDYSFSWQTFEIETVTSDSKPISLSVFFACQSEDGSFTDASVHEATIVQARVRYPKETLQLRTTDVVM